MIRRSIVGLTVLAVVASGRPLGGQAIPITLGTAGGLAAGAAISGGIFVAEARAGRFIYSVDEFLERRLELIPLPVGLATGMALGAADPDRLVDTAIGAFAGLAAGCTVGYVVGGEIWDEPEGPWAGLVIGGAGGILIGSVVGALLHDGGSDSAEPATFARVPIAVHVHF